MVIKNVIIDQQGALQSSGGGMVVTGVQDWTLVDVLFKKSYRFNFLALSQAVGVPNRTGTATFSNASAAVAGIGTAFLTELAVGDILKTAGGQFGRVEVITNNTSLTLTMPWGYATETGVTFKVIEPNSGHQFTRVRYEGTLAPADENGGIDASGYGLFDDAVLTDCEAMDANDGGCGFVPDHARFIHLLRPVSHGNDNSGISLETCEDSLITDPVTDGNGENGIQYISGTSRCDTVRGRSQGNVKDGYVVTFNTPNAGIPRSNTFTDSIGMLNGGYAFRSNGADFTEFDNVLGKNNDTGGAIVNESNSRQPNQTSIHDSEFFDDRVVKSQDRGIYVVSGTNTLVTDNTALNSLHVIAGIVDNGTNTTSMGNTV
ncbi:hypothetical protein ACFU44_13765 [Nocardia rhizosphaerihabitans]|uniref:hypothetical protein n=1 Tax=Nocardia rhizosphaerihabitans TaxID=1691570 RepID=UPI00366C8D44